MVNSVTSSLEFYEILVAIIVIEKLPNIWGCSVEIIILLLDKSCVPVVNILPSCSIWINLSVGIFVGLSAVMLIENL